jgi:hypothetical protein
VTLSDDEMVIHVFVLLTFQLQTLLVVTLTEPVDTTWL